jgi:hypothetical protein
MSLCCSPEGIDAGSTKLSLEQQQQQQQQQQCSVPLSYVTSTTSSRNIVSNHRHSGGGGDRLGLAGALQATCDGGQKAALRRRLFLLLTTAWVFRGVLAWGFHLVLEFDPSKACKRWYYHIIGLQRSWFATPDRHSLRSSACTSIADLRRLVALDQTISVLVTPFWSLQR